MRPFVRFVTRQNIFRSIAVILFTLFLSVCCFLGFMLVTSAYSFASGDYLCSVTQQKGHCSIPADIMKKGDISLKSGTQRRGVALEAFRLGNEHFRQLLETRRRNFETMFTELKLKRKQSALWRRAFPCKGLVKMYVTEMRFYRKGMRLYQKNRRLYRKAAYPGQKIFARLTRKRISKKTAGKHRRKRRNRLICNEKKHGMKNRASLPARRY